MEIGPLQSSKYMRSRYSYDTEKNVNWEEQRSIVIQTHPLRARLAAVWSLAVHCILSVAIVVAVLVYVDGHFFNVTERYPLVQVIDGTRKAPFRPMQSNVVTILSAAIAASKWALAAWVASLCWHVALFLMERHGIKHRNFHMLLDYSLLAPGAYSRSFSTWIVGVLLISGAIANFSSPILTGSVTWISSNQLARGLPINPVMIESMSNEVIPAVKELYHIEGTRETSGLKALGSADLAWGAGTNPAAFKRTLRNLDALKVNSTLETVILPYFEVHSIRWIDNSEADAMPGFKSLDKIAISAPLFNSSPIRSPPRPLGCALLIPNATTNWSSDPLEPTLIRDTRLLLLYYQYTADDKPGSPLLSDGMAEQLPPNTYQLLDNGLYFAFAWVTFTAGVGRCKDYECVISSPSTVQNNTPIAPEPHYFTSQALAMAPIVSLYLVTLNTSLPPPGDDLNAYVEAVLVRSYSGAWSGLIQTVEATYTNTSYIPSFPGLKAQVDWRRVNIWLGIQLLVTLLSALFLTIRAKLSDYPLSSGTSLIGFYLDTTGIPKRDNSIPSEEKWMLKIEPRGDRLKVILA